MTAKLIRLASLSSDITREREGEEIPIKDWPGVGQLPGLTFTVRSTQFPPYIAARALEQQRLAKKFDGGPIPPDELARSDGKLCAEHLLLGWKGLDQAFDPDTVEDILSAEEHRLLRDMVFWAATRAGKRDVEFVEDEAKN